MATDYAPDALLKGGREADRDIPGSTFSGVKGDSRHTYGYHRGRCVLGWGRDYSVKLSLDKGGPDCAASALDMSFTKTMMGIVTSRLRASALDPNDPRMECVREFYGTLNGSNVFGLIKDDKDGPWRSSSSDKSHLWHIHISFFRTFANDYNAVKGVIDVMKGVPWVKKPKIPTVLVSHQSGVYTVVSGDTLWDISKKYGMSVATLKKLNGLNTDTIYPGQKLKTKTAAKPTVKPTTPFLLKRGSKGALVSALQRGMNKIFPAYSKLAIDGDFGPRTEAVIKEFQRRAGISVDGIVGPVTRAKLASYGVSL